MISRTPLTLCVERLSMNEEEQWAFQWKDHPTNDIAGGQAGRELGGDVGQESVAVHRAIEQPRRDDPVMAQTGDKEPAPDLIRGVGRPVAMREARDQPLAPRGAAPQARHLGVHTALVEEHQP